ncbi:MAG: hypothetical protein Q8W45_11165 [Candidatus Palauibacterales bacterium]|nr:hypothetical protein [Candidatus Palauibacterales bacterium]MDP2483836.1 hypothetical protein [Candidatus Palauibacterales bacterium]
MSGSSGKPRLSPAPILAALLCVFLCGACDRSEERPAGAAELPSELTASQLRNRSYPSEILSGEQVPLVDGAYEDRDRRLTIRMLPEYAVGDLNGDGAPDAVVLLATESGGSGVFEDLAVVLNDARTANQSVVATFLGDREPVDRIRIDSGEVSIELLAHGPGDPMCCPSQKVTRRFRLEAGQIVRIDSLGEGEAGSQ